MEEWINEELKKVNRKTAEITHSPYFLRKNVQTWEPDYIDYTIKYGKPHVKKSTYELKRICFKNYFKNLGKTCFVVVEIDEDKIEVVTRYYEDGKY